MLFFAVNLFAFFFNFGVDCVCCFTLRKHKLHLRIGRGNSGKLTVSLPSFSALFIRRNERFI